ncbi:DUF3108 domain-containing protein [Shewanella sp. OMA3-2]|uniref:DUF3108 domain-containing protein n=1 Tax=Shewanella sp. OMA3-2 TaxID=2908650 RepID=UPI001F3AE82B|nr:DUF3108 domain-containing protein [Shewanella sp. OMA3-2]UJF20910.1 DUF3108 domain-containing protein [Shewanella sp. OMA3-2]
MQTTLLKSQSTYQLLSPLMVCLMMASFSATSSTLATDPILTSKISATDNIQNVAQETILLPLTPHTAQYKAYYGSIELGDAKYTLPATDSGYYNYLFESEVGLLMLSDERKLQSDFTLENGKLTPFRYVHERTGTGSDYTEQTAFAKSQNFIHTIYKQQALKLDYQELIFDPLMVQLQFRMDVIGNKRPLNYKMVKEKEVDEYDFKIIGNETITVAGGTFETVKFEVVRDSTKRQTFFWMAPKLAYLPIRLSHFSKGSKQLDIQLATYHFDKPLTDVPSLDIAHEHKIFNAYMAEKSLLEQGDTAKKVITDDEDFPDVSQDNISEREILEIKKMVID